MDPTLVLSQRASHAQSCAMLVAQNWKVQRSNILDAIRRQCGVDLAAVKTQEDIEKAIPIIELLRLHGLADAG